MGQKRRKQKTPGLFERNGTWHIDKKIFGRRICEATGTGSYEEAQAVLARRIEETRHAIIFGVRPKRAFKEAAVKYVRENQHKDSLGSDISKLRMVAPYVNDMPLDSIHMGTLQGFINKRREEGRKTRTINHGLKIIRHLLNLAASEWLDENGLTWIASAPKIKLLPEYDNRKPEPLSWEQEDRLMKALPEHLKRMALYAMHTGSRDKEVYWLQWEWEVKVPELNTSVFILPSHTVVNGVRIRIVKNGKDRLVVLNRVAKETIEQVRGEHPQFVFTYKGQPITRMNNTAWRNARKRAGLPTLRVHDLKHTFGRRLRAAGVSFEDRQDLLGHTSGRVTTHYSASELAELIEAANKACLGGGNGPTVSLVKRNAEIVSRKSPASIFEDVGQMRLSA